MIFQRKSINMIEKILLTYYYHGETKNILLNIYSKLLGHFHDLAHLTNKVVSSTYKENIISYGNDLREYFHLFKKLYMEYNLELESQFSILYRKEKLVKLRGKWKETLFHSDYDSEVNSLIHYLFAFEYDNITDIEKDINIFLFYQKRLDRNNKIFTSFIKLVFYFSVNYETFFKKVYEDINLEIYYSYNNY